MFESGLKAEFFVPILTRGCDGVRISLEAESSPLEGEREGDPEVKLTEPRLLHLREA
jgi:hypothetical protein